MSTVDEILASGRYTDRRGRGWDYVETVTSWCSPEIDAEGVSWGYRYIDTAQMRLLIERDQHECIGLRRCRSHPVPNVLALQDDISGARWGHGFGVYRPGIGDDREAWVDTLPEAMDAARALVVEP